MFNLKRVRSTNNTHKPQIAHTIVITINNSSQIFGYCYYVNVYYLKYVLILHELIIRCSHKKPLLMNLCFLYTKT